MTVRTPHPSAGGDKLLQEDVPARDAESERWMLEHPGRQLLSKRWKCLKLTFKLLMPVGSADFQDDTESV